MALYFKQIRLTLNVGWVTKILSGSQTELSEIKIDYLHQSSLKNLDYFLSSTSGLTCYSSII